MFLKNSPSLWVNPAILQPEVVAAMIIVVDEDVAAGNFCFVKLGENECDEFLGETLIPMGFGHGQMVDGPGAAVVAAQNRPNYRTIRIDGDGAESRIPRKKCSNGFWCV